MGQEETPMTSMTGGSAAKDHPFEYFAAATMAAILNYPLWRASAVGQSGFRVVLQHSPALSNLASSIPPSMAPYVHAFAPPYKGLVATVMGMSWARASIFYGSDRGKEVLASAGAHPAAATILPPLIISAGVQVVNMPLVRSTILLQNPESDLPNIRSSLRRILADHGVRGLWHGTSAGVLKTVPKYCMAIIVKDHFERNVNLADAESPSSDADELIRSAVKSAAAGVAGAALTNPLDVIRNEMFKTNLGLVDAVRSLHRELSWSFLLRGMGHNLVAVSIPVASTIFFTDALIQFSNSRKEEDRLR